MNMHSNKISLRCVILAFCLLDVLTMLGKDLGGWEKLFKDPMMTELKPDVKLRNIEKCNDTIVRNIALDIYNRTYPVEFRIQEFRQYQNPRIMAQINKTNEYSLLDNVTGIVASKGQKLMMYVDMSEGENARVKIQNLLFPGADGYMKGSSFYDLTPGLNTIIPKNDGLVYVLYHGPEANSGKKIKIHFLTGQVNGYFDVSKHEPSQWKTLLGNTVYPLFDVLGEKVHMTFPVETFKKNTPDGAALVKQFDRIISLEHEFMGIDKYNKSFNNRHYCHFVTKGYMYATNNRTAYGAKGPEKICNLENLKGIGVFGPAHEMGHCNQIRPGMKWHGMTEVTNNLYCMYVQTALGMPTRVQKELEHPSGMYDDCWYERAMTEYFSLGLPHNANPVNHCRLVPFWQLHLYLNGVKRLDFYPDLFELVRNTPNPDTDGECQLEFIRKTCAISGYNLLPFFEKYGFLTLIDKEVKDYAVRRFVVTQEQIDDLKKEIEGKKYRCVDLPIWYITDNTLNLFKNPKPLMEGRAVAKGNTITMMGWNNVAAYEVYKEGKLVFVSPLSSFTVEDSEVDAETEVMAVDVYGNKHKVSFSWTEDAEQLKMLKKRSAKKKASFQR